MDVFDSNSNSSGTGEGVVVVVQCSRSETFTVYALNGASNVGTHTLYARLWGGKRDQGTLAMARLEARLRPGLERRVSIYLLLLWNLGTGHSSLRVSEVLSSWDTRRAVIC